MRRRARVDANHAAIVAALRSCCWYVYDTSRLGGGYPDLTIARHGRIELVEVKDGSKPASARALTPAETRVIHDFAQAGVKVRIVESIDDAINLGRSYDDRQMAAKAALG